MLRVAVVNPTSLSNNYAKFVQLPCDLCLVSETSATKSMQEFHTRAFKKVQIQVSWGCPVPPQKRCIDGSESKRGCALGVCVLSKRGIPLRMSRDILPTHW